MTRIREVALLLVLSALLGCGRLRFEPLSAGVPASLDAGGDGARPLPDEGAVAFLDASANALVAERDDSAPGRAVGDGGADVSADVRSCPPGFAGASCTTCVRFVDLDSKSASADGLSWQTALSNITAGEVAAADESAAHPTDPYCQVWVREGRYYVYENSNADTIALSPVAPLYGGFAGTERDLSERDSAAHPTTLDGSDALRMNHVYHPVYSTSGGYIDGFTITGGRANAGSGPHADGGGLHVSGGMLVVRNVLFTDNTSTGHGGGIYAQNCVLTVDNSRFEQNTADKNGGAIAIQPVGTGVSAQLTVTASELRSNVAGGYGGGVASTGDVTLRLENLVIAENTAGGAAGGVYAVAGQAALVASTLYGNLAGSSAAGLFFNCSRPCSVTNSVLWDPSMLAESVLTAAVVRYSVVRGGATGTAISSADPLFVAAPTDLHLSAGSPAIDAADGCAGPERDHDGQPRRDLSLVANTGLAPVFSDCGAYEVQTGGSPYAPFSTLCP